MIEGDGKLYLVEGDIVASIRGRRRGELENRHLSGLGWERECCVV